MGKKGDWVSRHRASAMLRRRAGQLTLGTHFLVVGSTLLAAEAH